MRAAAIPSRPLFDASRSVSRTGRPYSKQPKTIAVIKPAQNTNEHRNRTIADQIIGQLGTHAAFQFHPGRNHTGEARVAPSRSPARKSTRRCLRCRSRRESPERATQSAHEIDHLRTTRTCKRRTRSRKGRLHVGLFFMVITRSPSGHTPWLTWLSRQSSRESGAETQDERHPAG